MRTIGIRDIAIGLGAWVALRGKNQPGAGWLRADVAPGPDGLSVAAVRVA
jgi:hypothetical protein